MDDILAGLLVRLEHGRRARYKCVAASYAALACGNTAHAHSAEAREGGRELYARVRSMLCYHCHVLAINNLRDGSLLRSPPTVRVELPPSLSLAYLFVPIARHQTKPSHAKPRHFSASQQRSRSDSLCLAAHAQRYRAVILRSQREREREKRPLADFLPCCEGVSPLFAAFHSNFKGFLSKGRERVEINYASDECRSFSFYNSLSISPLRPLALKRVSERATGELSYFR